MRLSWVKQFRHVGAICALAALNPNCFLAYRLATADSKLREISIHDEVRRYILHVPVSYTKTKPTALFVVLHGGGGNGRNAEEMTGFTEKSEKEGFLVLYPYGTGRFDTRFLTWNAGDRKSVV